MSLNQIELEFFEMLKKRAEANPPKPYQEQSFAEHKEGAQLLFSEFTGEYAMEFEDKKIVARDGYSIPIRIIADVIKSHL